MRSIITICILAFIQLFVTMAHASPGAPVNVKHQKTSAKAEREDDRRKRRLTKHPAAKKTKVAVRKLRVLPHKKMSAAKKNTLHPASLHSTHALATAKIVSRKKHHGHHHAALTDSDTAAPLRLSKIHRARYQKARATAMNKLMGQLGKPYQWGGTSPRTGFDCSGLVWYAYKDLVKFKIPRTANEMYHLRDAASVNREALEKGDLVFFRISGRGTADHVGVYLGNGKFIQSPRSGKDIQISALSSDYWQNHYIGARRMMTPKTIR